ncbi:acetyl-CoA carboxylase biotin carboxyl carrier protein [Acidobacteriota bacterium]
MSKKEDKKSTESIDMELIQFIGDISQEAKKKNLTRITLKLDDLTVEVENIAPVLQQEKGMQYVPLTPPVIQEAAERLPEEVAVSPPEELENLEEVISPITGTFYSAPAPKEPPFVKKGDRVETGTTLCIVEAMKVMNKINSKHSGQIHSIGVKNGQLVQTGQMLMRISPD